MKAKTEKSGRLEDWVWKRLISDDFSGTIEDLEKWLNDNGVDYTEEELQLTLGIFKDEKKIELLGPIIVLTKKGRKVLAFLEINVPAHVKIQERKIKEPRKKTRIRSRRSFKGM